MINVSSASLHDVPMVIDVIAEAFSSDPTWTWAFPDISTRKKFWNLLISNALRYPTVYKTKGFEAVSVWIPPNGVELPPEVEESLPEILEELVGARASEVLELLQKFGDAHPHSQPHYYLSLLGVQHNFRGQGLGIKLLKENLAQIDAEKMPAYLESSNPVNNHRYESLGFAPVVSFNAPNNGPAITGMWRQGLL